MHGNEAVRTMHYPFRSACLSSIVDTGVVISFICLS